MTPNPHRIRWWPAALILVLAAAAYGVLLSLTLPSQQAFSLGVAKIVLATGALLFVWLILFSRLRWKVRWSIFGLTVVIGVVLAGLFRMHGVSGNLVPILEPRWVHRESSVPIVIAVPAAVKSPPGEVDFPQFMGPNRDGHLSGPKLSTNWTGHPPAQLWRQPVGAAWSGFAVAGAITVTQEQRGEDECVIAYDLLTGKPLWSHADKVHYANALAGEGPRATPTIAGSRVVTHGGNGLLNCLNLADGHVLWSHENIGSVPTWGEATSPLVANDLVYVAVGASNGTVLAAYRLTNGALAWFSPAPEAGYSSPIETTLLGVKQILIFADPLLGCDPITGRQLWQYSWPGMHPHVATPLLVNGSDVVISSGYGTGSARLKLEHDATGKWSVNKVWRTNRMKAKFTDLILVKDHIYGLDDGIMECIDAATGGLAWKDGRYGHGQILLVGQWLFLIAENGDIVLIDPQPDRLRELTRFTVLHEKTWNPPALAGDYLLVRNDKEAACFRMSQ